MPFKPQSLEELYEPSREVFDLLRGVMQVEKSVSINLESVDLPVEELTDRKMIAAFAMRRLQALRHQSHRHTATSAVVMGGTLAELLTLLVSTLKDGAWESNEAGRLRVQHFLLRIDAVFADIAGFEGVVEDEDIVLYGTLYPPLELPEDLRDS